MQYDDVPQLVEKLESDFTSGNGVQMSEYVHIDAKENIDRIYAYLNSKHISGSTDALGREKPFFNIVLAARNIWYRATDIDRKHIFAKPTKTADVIGAFLLSVKLQEWMRKEHFGQFLNQWGLVQSGFNSCVVKFVEQDNRLIPSVVPWSRLIFDQVDFDNNPVIEVLELTKAQMLERFDKDKVEALESAHKARETLDGQRKDNKPGYYKVYEVHGLFPLSFLTGKEKDEDTFVQQMHAISLVANKKTRKNDSYTLYSGREKQSPYMLTALLPSDDGSVSFDGAVKNLFDAQWMQNHTAKAIKDQLDLASKLIFQTADDRFLGQNALYAIETGDILIHSDGKPLTQVANNSHDVASLINYGQSWKTLANEINGISEAMMGINPPSGSAWRQTEAMLQESHNLFQQMKENRGLDIERMMRQFVFPYLKKQMKDSKEVVADLDTYGIQQIEKKYIKNAGKKLQIEQAKKSLLSGQIAEMMPTEDAEMQAQSNLLEQGQYRFFKPSDIPTKTWKDIFKDIEWEAEVDVTGENTDKQAVYTTLNTALQVSANPNFQTNPTAQMIVGKLLMESSVISPLEWAQTLQEQRQQPAVQDSGGNVPTEQLQELAKQQDERTTNV